MSHPPPRPPAPGTGPGRGRVPRREIPTPVQLGTRPTVILLRGTFGRCPACGGRHVFHRWFTMAERCPTCTLRFERVEGHWMGSIGTNTVVVFGIMFVVVLGVALASYPESPGAWLLLATVGIAVIGPAVLFPQSRMLWTAIDLLMRPLRPGEIDPRFVVHDPARDRPRRS